MLIHVADTVVSIVQQLSLRACRACSLTTAKGPCRRGYMQESESGDCQLQVSRYSGGA